MPIKIVEDVKAKFVQPITNANLLAIGALAIAALALLIAMSKGGK